ncbi:MAG: nucleotide pyrophosphohydrolase [Nanoarchaeota archaeon]
MNDLQELRKLLQSFRDRREWKQFHNPKDLSIAISVEAAELLEHFQWHTPKEIETILKERRTDISHELADILSFVILFADATGIDISEAVKAKLDILEKKYPVDKVKGKNLKYDEY